MHGDSTTGVKLQSRSYINVVNWSSKYPTQLVLWYDASAMGPHLRLESGTELYQGSTTPSCCTFVYCSALCPKVQTSACIILQPAKPPICRCLHLQRIRVCQKKCTNREVHDISDPLRPGGPAQCGRPGAQERYCLCITSWMPYSFALAHRSCATSEYPRVWLRPFG